ncbi:MAG: hypothetical protein ACM3YN_08645 [Parcubacteria group bacterium]
MKAFEMAQRLSSAMAWLDPPFVDENTSPEELRQRIRFMLADARPVRELLGNGKSTAGRPTPTNRSEGGGDG